MIRTAVARNLSSRATNWSGDNAGPVVISPDGKYLLYLALGEGSRPMLWLRPTGALAATPLPGTDDSKFPFWSPDSKSIGFFQAAKLRVSVDYLSQEHSA